MRVIGRRVKGPVTVLREPTPFLWSLYQPFIFFFFLACGFRNVIKKYSRLFLWKSKGCYNIKRWNTLLGNVMFSLKKKMYFFPLKKKIVFFSSGALSGLKQTRISDCSPTRTIFSPENTCTTCGKNFISGYVLRRHLKIHSGEKPFTCPTCDRTFSRKDHMKSHILRVHQVLTFD